MNLETLTKRKFLSDQQEEVVRLLWTIFRPVLKPSPVCVRGAERTKVWLVESLLDSEDLSADSFSTSAA